MRLGTVEEKKYYHKKCRNNNSIGIEMCLTSKNMISDRTIQNTVELVQLLMKKYKIAPENVVRHYDVTHKLCPAPFIEKQKWRELKKQLVGETSSKKEYIKVISIGTDGKGLAVRKKPDWNATPIVYVKMLVKFLRWLIRKRLEISTCIR